MAHIEHAYQEAGQANGGVDESAISTVKDCTSGTATKGGLERGRWTETEH